MHSTENKAVIGNSLMAHEMGALPNSTLVNKPEQSEFLAENFLANSSRL